jgi:hypothetical protein
MEKWDKELMQMALNRVREMARKSTPLHGRTGRDKDGKIVTIEIHAMRPVDKDEAEELVGEDVPPLVKRLRALGKA